MSQQQLMRSESDKMIAGVCGGLASYLNIDPTLVRLAFVVLLLATGVGLAIYLILWVVMPSDTQGLESSIIVNGEKDYRIEDPKALKTLNNPAATAGIVLVLLGGFFLLSQLGWMSSAFWPLVLVGAGVYFIVRRNR